MTVFPLTTRIMVILFDIFHSVNIYSRVSTIPQLSKRKEWASSWTEYASEALQKQGLKHEPKSRAGGQGQWWNWPTRWFGRSSNPQTARKRQKKRSVTDGPTDQQMDRVGHRVACTQLKMRSCQFFSTSTHERKLWKPNNYLLLRAENAI